MKACGDRGRGSETCLHPEQLGVLAAICVVAGGLLGCNKRAEIDPQVRQEVSLKEERLAIKSVAELRKLLAPGMSTNDVVEKLGRPDREEITTSGIFWRYQLSPFPADNEMQGTHVIGVILGLTNGHLAEWGCAYVGTTRGATLTGTQPLVDPVDGDRSTALKFFAVSSQPVEQGRYVDTEQLPRLGYISSKPQLAIKRLKAVKLEERSLRETDGRARTVWVFKCSVDERDAAQFKALTAANVLKRILIMAGDEPLVAPTIFAPIEDGRFEIECQNRSLMESVKRLLAGTERQDQ